MVDEELQQEKFYGKTVLTHLKNESDKGWYHIDDVKSVNSPNHCQHRHFRPDRLILLVGHHLAPAPFY
jgi:hypothetical protein